MLVRLLGLGDDELELLLVELVLGWVFVASHRLDLLDLVHPVPQVVLLVQLALLAEQESLVADAMGALLVAEPSEGLQDGLPHLSVVLGLVGRDLEVSLFLVPVKGAFHGVDIGNLERIEEHLPGREVAAAPESVGPVVEPLVVLADHHGEYLDEVGEVGAVVGVEKGA